VMQLVTTLVVQTALHYMILLYSDQFSYNEVVTIEFNMRDRACYVATITSNMQQAFIVLSCLL
jgi:hypothetical protein